MTQTAEELKNAGNLHVQEGRFAEAEKSYRAAIAADISYVPAWNNLANVLFICDKLADSITAYQIALSFKPDHISSLMGLANACTNKGVPEEAVVHLKKALLVKPDYAPLHNTLGNAFKELGQLSDSLAAYRHGISLLMQKTQFPAQRPKEYMDVALAHNALLALKAALDAEGIPFFLAYGTLLGIVRDGELLPHDKDMDVGLAWDTDRNALLATLTGKYGFAESQAQLNAPEKNEWSISLRHQKTSISVDLFFFKPDGNTLLSGFYHRPTPLLWRFNAFETQSFEYLGQSWQVPAPPEQFLREIYGAGWQTPDIYFDSIVSGMNRVPEAQEVALCYAYNRLFDRVNRSEWKKASGYCRQILAHTQDPVIEALSAWLAARV